LCALALPPLATDWIVVRVVVRERTEGAGEEKVLSPPRRESCAPIVRAVPVTEEAPWDRAAMDREVSWSVETVRVTDLAPDVWGTRLSADERCSRDVSLPLRVDAE
jgi:hypothetical protein